MFALIILLGADSSLAVLRLAALCNKVLEGVAAVAAELLRELKVPLEESLEEDFLAEDYS